ncbi:MAG: flagellar export chaperone FliS [Oscillospiraceae bacterium]|jgi:flagellar protein FliS|nr:flagellar export chaperone FliS [Oscillospiraceae bacterium]
MTNAFAQYKNQSLSVMTQGELLVKLFDEITKQCQIARIGIEKADFITANFALVKAQSILSTLAESLDMRYPVSKNLHELYIFFARQFMEANSKNTVKPIDDVMPLIKDLRASFEQAEKLSRSQQAIGGQAV